VLKAAAKLAAAGMGNFVQGNFEPETRPVVIADERALRLTARRAEEAEGARRGYSTGA
jgi:hypothetical protein